MPDPLRVLGFDTSAAHCAAAVVCGDRLLAFRAEPMARGQAERLFPLIEELLAEAGLTWAGLDAIGVGVGPGNFTGVRISVAAARGLALSLGVPAVGVSATEAAACDASRPCRAVVPLRADEVVWEDFAAFDGDAASASGMEGLKNSARKGRAEPASPVPELSPADIATARRGCHPGLAPTSPGTARDVAAEGLSESAGRVASQRETPQPLCDRDIPKTHGAGPSLGRAGDLPPGPPACAAVHPAAVSIALIAARRVAAIQADAGMQGAEDEAGDRAPGRALELAGQRLPRPSPLYLRPADAAPPRDPPPKILR